MLLQGVARNAGERDVGGRSTKELLELANQLPGPSSPAATPPEAMSAQINGDNPGPGESPARPEFSGLGTSGTGGAKSSPRMRKAEENEHNEDQVGHLLPSTGVLADNLASAFVVRPGDLERVFGASVAEELFGRDGQQPARRQVVGHMRAGLRPSHVRSASFVHRRFQ